MPLEVGNVYEGKITGITKFGAFVEFETGEKGLVHISEVSSSYVEDVSQFVSNGDVVKVKVLSLEDKKINLSIKQAAPDYKPHEKRERNDRDNRAKRPRRPREPYKPAPPVTSPGNFQWEDRQSGASDFEDMMSSFKKNSEDKMCDLKKGKESRGYSRRGNGGGRK